MTDERQHEMDRLHCLLDLDADEVVEYNIDNPGQVTVRLQRRFQSSDIPAEACEILGIPHRPSLALIKKRVEKIVGVDASDASPEEAHGEQDSLYEDVLRCVHEGHPDAAAMVAEALRVADSKGTRWYS